MDDRFPHFLLSLVLILVGARLLGALARRLGQPAVLGELLAGVLLGPSVLGQWPALAAAHLEPADETLRLLAELGVAVLLFEIGLETDLTGLFAVGRESAAVAVVGVVLPFGLGYAACRLLGSDGLTATVAGATLTATSVGITARVLGELGRLQDPEGRIILGAAVLDDILGLVILAVVAAQMGGVALPFAGVVRIAGLAFGFVAVALAVGWFAVPRLARMMHRFAAPERVGLSALVLGLALAYLADRVQPGLAIVGAFTAGVLLSRAPQAPAMHRGLAPLGHFFVPIFFVMTGAEVDVALLNPARPENRAALGVGMLLLAAAVLGKLAAGYAPFWFRGRKAVVGVGMVPRGEVGLVFANTGRAVVGPALFSALALVIMITTFLVPPVLRLLLGSPRKPTPTPVGELAVEP